MSTASPADMGTPPFNFSRQDMGVPAAVAPASPPTELEWASIVRQGSDVSGLSSVFVVPDESTGHPVPSELCVRNTFLSLEPRTVMRRTNSAPEFRQDSEPLSRDGDVPIGG